LKKKILVLTPRYPYSVVGGARLRIMGICEQLAKKYSLSLLSLCDTAADMTSPLRTDGIFDSVERIHLPRWKSLLNAALALPVKTPLQIAYYRSGEFRKRIGELLPGHDAVLAHLIRTGDYVKNVSMPSVLEMTDAIALSYSRTGVLNGRGGLRERAFAIEARRLKKYEQQTAKEFSIVSLISPIDRDFLWPDAPPNVVVCSNGVDLNDLKFVGPEVSSKVLIFVGNINTLQNFDACRHFVEDILPTLRKTGGYSFRIIGNIRPEDRAVFEKHDGVTVTGRVPSIAHAAQGALAGICSVRMGAGVQNKILEYMSLGLPTLTSAVGLEGLHARPGDEILLADTPQDYMQHLTRLAHDSAYALALGKAARAYVERHHSWDSVLSPLNGKIDALINAAR
jgi:glycosyltransferase involved in cell wall biosynthesis